MAARGSRREHLTSEGEDDRHDRRQDEGGRNAAPGHDEPDAEPGRRNVDLREPVRP
jgi:hypothetical protein